MTDRNRRHVFISHHHADDAGVDALTRLLRRDGMEVRNSSIRAKPANQRRLDRGLVSDETIRRLLRMKISWAGSIIVLIGRDTHSRQWVNWEIEQAHKQGKNIIGVHLRGSRDADIPPALEKYSSSIVGWQAAKIRVALTGTAPAFELPDGTPRQPTHQMPSSQC